MTRERLGCGAFTLIELLVAISIIAVLVAILLPILSSVRKQRNELVCLSSIRSSGSMLEIYSFDNRGYMPFGGVTPRMISTPYGAEMLIGGVDGLDFSRWTFFFEEYWTEDAWNRGMTCPSQPVFEDTGYVESQSGVMSRNIPNRRPWYFISSAFHISSGSLSRSTVVYEDLIVKAQPLYGVRYTSLKSLLFEQLGFCVSYNSSTAPYLSRGLTYPFPTSIACADGSAARFSLANAISPAIGQGCDFTKDGIMGRDIDRSLIGARY